MKKSFLEINALKKSFTPGVSAVNEVSLTVDAGEIVCLLGPSGCGKTTLLRMIAGLERPDSGQVFFGGREITALATHRRGFGMMFQDFALFPHKNVFDNVAFGLQTRGDSPAATRRRAAEMLELVDLRGFEDRDISLLSGGEQQRVALARSLATGPQLLMLDEPLGALDRALRERLMLELRQILKRVGVTALYVTHDQTEAFAIADRIAVMNAGRIEQLDAPQRIYARPASAFTARFLGFHNLLPGRVTPSGAVETAIGVLPLNAAQFSAGERVTVLIKPDAVKSFQLSAFSGQQSAFSFQQSAFGGQQSAVGSHPSSFRLPPSSFTIAAISFRGKYYQVWFEAAGQRLMFELPSAEGWQVGDTARLTLDTEKMLVL